MPYATIEEIEKRLRSLRTKAEEKKYSKFLLDLIFGLLNVDPGERLKVKEVKLRLEEELGETLSENFKDEFQLLKRGESQEIKKEKVMDYFEAFKLEANQVFQKFEEGYSKSFVKLDGFETQIMDLKEKLNQLISGVQRMKDRRAQEIQETSRSYKRLLNTILHENTIILAENEKLKAIIKVFEELDNGVHKKRFEEFTENFERMKKVKLELQKKWEGWFDIELDEGGVLVKSRENTITDKIFQNWLEDFEKTLIKANIRTDLINMKTVLNNCNQLTKYGFESLEDNQSFLENMKSFKLKFMKCAQINESTFADISQRIGIDLKKLHYLDLSQWENKAIADGEVSFWTDFESFSCQGLNWNHYDQSVDKVEYPSVNLQNLNHLALRLNNFEEIIKRDVKDLGREIGVHLENLRNLELELSGFEKMNYETVKNLCAIFGSSLQNLNCFILDLSDCTEITDEGLKKLTKYIGKNLQDLSFLRLIVSNCDEIPDSGL